jgi:ribose/xylose/arabinose/galactoside ABC-type transport system permease subunit
MSEAVKDPGPADDRAPRRGPFAGLSKLANSHGFQGSISVIAFLAVFLAYYIWLGSKFANVEARALDIHQNAPVLILGLAVLVTLIAGQFDLSVASLATLTTYLATGLQVNQGWPAWLAVVLCLLIGVLGGLINGFLVVKLRVNTFIATLGTGGAFAGFASVYGKGTQLSPTSSTHQLADWFSGPGSLGDFGDKVPELLIWIPLAVVAIATVAALRHRRPASLASLSDRAWLAIVAAGVIVVAAILVGPIDIGKAVESVSWTMALLFALAVGLWVLLEYTTYGRYLRAIGSSPTAARLARINPDKETMKAFVLGGCLAALAGVVLAANQGSAAPEVAASFLLPAFAAAFLSTVIFSTGRFNVGGTIVGGVFLVWVSQGLIVGGLPFTWTNVVNGVVLILAVALSTTLRRHRIVRSD